MAAKPKGRPSKLSDKQWAEIQERLLAGESASSLSKIFKVGRSTITDRFSGINGKIKDAANQILEVENTLLTLPISARVSAISLADELRVISSHLAGAGKFGAMTAHRLSGMANQQVDKIDEVNPSASTEALQSIAILTKRKYPELLCMPCITVSLMAISK